MSYGGRCNSAEPDRFTDFYFETEQALSEAQTANAQGGRQVSLWELRSSPVPGEAELGVPESEVAAAGDEQQAHEHTISQRTEWRRRVSTPYFIWRLL